VSVTITKRVATEKLPKILPRRFAGLADGFSGVEPMTVLVFDDDPVHSSALRKALHRIAGSQESIVCFARDFTIEARELAAKHSAQIVSETFFGWSDKRHEDIKTLIGSKVKTPDLR
jgi:hypothetical protein